MEEVCGHSYNEPIQGKLYGYKKYDTPLGYPFIIPWPDSKVMGIIWTGLVQKDWEQIDHYEGLFERPPLYFREPVWIKTKNASTQACVYVGNIELFCSYIDEIR